MMQQSFPNMVSKLTDAGLRTMLAAGLVFAGLTAYYNLWLCLGEVVALLVLYLLLRESKARRRNALLAYLDGITSDVTHTWHEV